jgi:hypothetical protein
MELQGRRACPKCKGPLISQQQLETYQANTKASLERLKQQSSSTLAGGALLAMGIQSVINIVQHDPEFSMLTSMVFAGGIVSMVIAGLWWRTGRRSYMLAASIIFQITAFIYGFSFFTASTPLLDWAISLHRRVGQAVSWIVIAGGATPLGLALLAWHQYRSYMEVLKPR